MHSLLTTSVYFGTLNTMGSSCKDRKTALFSALATDQEKNLLPWTNTPMAMGPYYYVQFREHSHRVNIPCCFELTEEGEVVFEMNWKKMLEELLQKGVEALRSVSPIGNYQLPSYPLFNNELPKASRKRRFH